MATRFRSLRFGFLEGAALACLAGAGIALALPWREERHTISRETAALEALRRVAKAEEAFRVRGARDANRDGAPEYGYLEDLMAAGLLADSFVAEPEGGATLGGYRFEVQLPAGVVPGGRTTLSRSGGRPDPILSRSTFVASAIPNSSEGSGLRSFLLDASGKLYAAEGVIDPGLRPRRPPPALVVEGTSDDSLAGQPTWRLAESGKKPP